MERPTVIFLHIPKTAGFSLNRIIEQNYPIDQFYSTYGAEDLPGGSVQSFLRLSPARRAQIRMLAGHVPFGFHEQLPGPVTYFTVLREPIDRVVSLYYYLRRAPKDRLPDDQALAHEMTLEQYVGNRVNVGTDNLQVRMVSGVFCNVGYGQCTRDMLEAAKQNLRERFAVVGLSEQFDATLLLLKRAFHWRNIYYVRWNVTKDRPALAEVPAETLALIRDHNLLDIELYQFAKSLFETQLKHAGPFFAQRVEFFRAANRRHPDPQRLSAQLRLRLSQDSLRAQQLAARQSSNQRLQPVLRLYWLARQYSIRAWIRGIPSSHHDTA
jgi:hypothetical protein